MSFLANVLLPDILDSPDAISFWVVRAMFLLGAGIGAWLAFDTRRALKIMVGLGQKTALGRRLSIDPENAAWIWFYRIDGAVMFACVLWVFAQHYFAR